MTIRLRERHETPTATHHFVRPPRRAENAPSRHKIHVMLVDDELAFRQVATLFLETHYAQEIDVVGTARDGEECLAQAQLLAPEVILIDLHMPGLSGLQTIPLLRILFPETRIIALTLSDDERSRRAVLDAGGNDLVSKTTMRSDLVPAIRRVMAQELWRIPLAQA